MNPDILPREYGGKTYSVEECIGLWREELEHNRSTLLQLDQLKVAGVRSLSLSHQIHHKVHIYLEYHSVCPLVGIGTLSPPLLQASVLPPGTKGETHLPACEEVGESEFGRLERKLSTLQKKFFNAVFCFL